MTASSKDADPPAARRQNPPAAARQDPPPDPTPAAPPDPAGGPAPADPAGGPAPVAPADLACAASADLAAADPAPVAPPDPAGAPAPADPAGAPAPADPAGAPAPADSAGGPARLAADLRAAIGPLVRRLRQFRPDDELTLSQTSALVRLDREGPATGSELAAGEGVRPQSMAAILAVLHERGLVTREADPADGRRILVSLSEAGRAGLHGARREKGRRLTQAISDELTPEEQAALAAALPLLERITRHV